MLKKIENNNGLWDVYNLDDIQVGVLDNCNIIEFLIIFT